MARIPPRRARVGRAIDEVEDAHLARSAVALSTLLGRDAVGSIAASPIDQFVDDVDYPVWLASSSSAAVRSMLPAIEDGRLFSPSPDDVASRSSRRWRPRLIVARAKRPAGVGQAAYAVGHVQWRSPGAIAVCVRRKLRRKAIFAMGKAGGRHRRPRRGSNSHIWC